MREFGHRIRLVAAAATAAGCVFCAGCGASSEQEREYFDQLAEEEQARTALRAQITAPAQIEEQVTSMVMSNAAPDGAGTVQQWIERLRNTAGGQIYQPRWRVVRRSASGFDVRYEYTLLKTDGGTDRKGYVWTVDTMLRSISIPREMTLAPRNREVIAPPASREERIRREEAEIE